MIFVFKFHKPFFKFEFFLLKLLEPTPEVAIRRRLFSAITHFPYEPNAEKKNWEINFVENGKYFLSKQTEPKPISLVMFGKRHA